MVGRPPGAQFPTPVVSRPPEQPRPAQPPFGGRPPSMPQSMPEKKDPNADNMAKMIGKLTARVDFLEQDLNLGQDTPKGLMDRLRSLEENAIKSIHGDENEFVLKPYLKDKLSILEQRMEPLEKIPMNYSIDIEAVMDRLTKAEETIGDVKTKLIGMIYKHKDLEGRLDSLEESVASKVIKAIKESKGLLDSDSKMEKDKTKLNIKKEKFEEAEEESAPKTSTEVKKEVKTLKQQFNNMDMLVTKSLEETTKSNHHINTRLQKLESSNNSNKEVHAFLSQVKLLKQNSVGLKVLDARVDTLENSLTNQSKDCSCDCKDVCKSKSSSSDANPLAVSITPVDNSSTNGDPIGTSLVPTAKKSKLSELKAIKTAKVTKIKTEKTDFDSNVKVLPSQDKNAGRRV